MKSKQLKTIIPSVLLLSNATVAKAFDTVNGDDVLNFLSALMPFHGDLLVSTSPTSPFDKRIAACDISLSPDRKLLTIDHSVIPLKRAKFYSTDDAFIIEYARSDEGTDTVQIHRMLDSQGGVVITYNWNSKIFKYCRKSQP